MSKVEFHLRPWTSNDLENLVKFANNKNIAKYLTNAFPHPYTKSDGIAFIDRVSKPIPVEVFAISIGLEAVGAIGLHPQGDIHIKNAEMGYWLAEPFWGNGIITKAIPQMVEYGFRKFDINRIFARPFGSNIASQRVLQKAGFVLEGKLDKTIYKYGKYEDELIYAVRK